METPRRTTLSRLLPLLLVAAALSGGSPAASASKFNSGGGKVPLVLYYESLCPYCSNFIVNYLSEIFENDLISIIDLRLVPYGNAKIGDNNTISCQHGPSECLLNTVEACAIDAWPQLSEHFPLIYCIEKLVSEHEYPQWASCFDELGMDRKRIHECYTSGRGNELELGYADETGALQPPHQYVPWVTVNGNPLYDDYENFVSYICEAYTGVSAPEACNEASVKGKAINRKIVSKKNKVCNTTASSFRALIRRAVERVMMSWMNMVA